MNTKIKLLKAALFLVVATSSFGVWSQTSQTITQDVCPGTEPYLVTPGNAANTFLWSITTGATGVDWTISTPNSASTNIVWANPLIPVIYHLLLTETNSDGCDRVVSMDVTVNPKPAAPTATLIQPSCSVSTGSIEFTSPAVGAGITYTITGTNPVQAAVTNSTGLFTGLISGDYDIITSNTYGCSSVIVSVTIDPQPSNPVTSAIWHN